TEDTVGIVKGQHERLPHALYLRDTALTKPTAPIRALAAEIAAAAGPIALDRLHGLMHRLADTITLVPAPIPAAPCPAA
ncbi:hypothetical protein J8J40_34290, partial [Mycobacterium tuberculosis]|nr:hypothetical protein [Mycobacterium tuberculosis]